MRNRKIFVVLYEVNLRKLSYREHAKYLLSVNSSSRETN